MSHTDTEVVREALAIESDKRALEIRYGENQKALKTLLKSKGCLRLVVGQKIVTLSASNGGKVIQTHVSELDGVIE